MSSITTIIISSILLIASIIIMIRIRIGNTIISFCICQKYLYAPIKIVGSINIAIIITFMLLCNGVNVLSVIAIVVLTALFIFVCMITSKLKDGRVKIAEGQAKYNAGLEKYNAGLNKYNAGLEKYNYWSEQYNRPIAGIFLAMVGVGNKLEDGRKELEDGEEQLANGKYQLDNGALQLSSGRIKIAKAEKLNKALILIYQAALSAIFIYNIVLLFIAK